MLLIPVFSSACVTDKDRALLAGMQLGEIEASKKLAEYPDDCRKSSRSGVRKGERLDVALLRTDQALTRQNNRTDRCADWYDELKINTENSGMKKNER